VDTGTIAFIAIAVAAGGLVQGLSGLGFALVSAPVVSQLVPGTAGIGLVNALSVVQNGWLIGRLDAPIAWREVRRLAPGLVLGIALGWLVLQRSDPRIYDVIVAVSASASVAWLLTAGRFTGPVAGFASAVWGALVNTAAGVGGPPLAAYLVTRGLDVASYIRTLQVIFAGLSLVSLPMLGVYVPSIAAAVGWVIALVAGSWCGELIRRHVEESRAQHIARAAIVAVCSVALVRALLALAA
jgi:uncharacterized protein